MENLDTMYARWLSGELTEQELASLRESGELEELEKMKASLEGLSLPAYNKDAAFDKLQHRNSSKNNVTGQESSTISESTKRRTLGIGRVLAIAATLLILVSAFFFFPDSSTQISAPNGVEFSYDFQDGSSVKLNDGSSLSLKEKNWATSRSVSLTGEAYFEVEKNEAPFIIDTRLGRVEVLGTKFNVRS